MCLSEAALNNPLLPRMHRIRVFLRASWVYCCVLQHSATTERSIEYRHNCEVSDMAMICTSPNITQKQKAPVYNPGRVV